MLALLDMLPSNLRDTLGANPSILSMRTSEPKYLIFSDFSDNPAYVIQSGKKQELFQIEAHTRYLYEVLPTRIPEPLAIFSVSEEFHLIQKGIGGIPWFTVRQRLGREFQWQQLVDLSGNALLDFHAASSSNFNWLKNIDLANMFISLRAECDDICRVLNGHEQVLEYSLNALSNYQSLQCFQQHGDFCVNNLMFNGRNTGIIDFEQFGRVTLPLHDEFGLTASLLKIHESPTAGVAESLWRQVSENCKYDFADKKEILNALVVMHIYWWLIEIHGRGQELRLLRKQKYMNALTFAYSQIQKNKYNFLGEILLVLAK